MKDKMIKLFLDYGWEIKTGTEQLYGSPSDIYAECNDQDGDHRMFIDDGNCHQALNDAVYHIYAPGGKIFEGRITSKSEFKCVMKVLGFKELHIEELEEGLEEVESPVGDFILNNARTGISTQNGAYYPYAEVCYLLNLYKEELEK